MPGWLIALLIVIAVLIVALVVLVIVGNKLKKRQDEQQAQIEAAKQTMTMLIIDKKKMKLKDANLPKIVMEQVKQQSKLMLNTKMPLVKAKIGPRIMTLMCDPNVFEQIPLKAEIKAEVSGIYIVGIKSVRGGIKQAPVEEPKKKGLFGRKKDK